MLTLKQKFQKLKISLPKQMYFLFGSLFLYYLGDGLRYFLPIIFLQRDHYSLYQMGILFSIMGAGEIAGSYCGGYFTHRFDSVNVSILSIIIKISAIILIASVLKFHLLWLVMFFYGLALGTYRSSNRVSIVSLSKQNEVAATNALQRAVFSVALGLAVSISGGLSYINFYWVFGFAVIMHLGALFVLFFINTQGAVAQVIAKVKHDPLNQKKYTNTLILIFVFFAYFIICTLFFQLAGAYPVFLKKTLGISNFIYSLLFLLNAILVLILEAPIFLMMRTKKQDHLMISSVGLMFLGLNFLVLTFFGSVTALFLAMILLTVGEIFMFSPLFTFVIEQTNSLEKGRVIGSYQMTAAIAKALAPMMGLSMLHAFSGRVLWIACAIFTFFCLLILLSVRKYLNR